MQGSLVRDLAIYGESNTIAKFPAAQSCSAKSCVWLHCVTLNLVYKMAWPCQHKTQCLFYSFFKVLDLYNVCDKNWILLTCCCSSLSGYLLVFQRNVHRLSCFLLASHGLMNFSSNFTDLEILLKFCMVLEEWWIFFGIYTLAGLYAHFHIYLAMVAGRKSC